MEEWVNKQEGVRTGCVVKEGWDKMVTGGDVIQLKMSQKERRELSHPRMGYSVSTLDSIRESAGGYNSC